MNVHSDYHSQWLRLFWKKLRTKSRSVAKAAKRAEDLQGQRDGGDLMDEESFRDVELVTGENASGSGDAPTGTMENKQCKQGDVVDLMQSATPPWRQTSRRNWEDDRRRRRTIPRHKRARSPSREKKGKAKGRGGKGKRERDDRPSGRVGLRGDGCMAHHREPGAHVAVQRLLPSKRGPKKRASPQKGPSV